jgi:hypothetical protein
MVKRFLSPAGTCRTIRVKEQPVRYRTGLCGGIRRPGGSVDVIRVTPR